MKTKLERFFVRPVSSAYPPEKLLQNTILALPLDPRAAPRLGRVPTHANDPQPLHNNGPQPLHTDISVQRLWLVAVQRLRIVGAYGHHR